MPGTSSDPVSDEHGMGSAWTVCDVLGRGLDVIFVNCLPQSSWSPHPCTWNQGYPKQYAGTGFYGTHPGASGL